METTNGVIGNFLLLFATLLPLLREQAPTQVPNHPRIIQGGARRTSHYPHEIRDAKYAVFALLFSGMVSSSIVLAALRATL